MNESILHDEVIIANDGSQENTKQLIADFQKKFPVPLIHIWQVDINNRKTRIINKAISAANYDYIVKIDVEIIMNNHFVKDYLTFAK